jgi:hypothetical protein
VLLYISARQANRATQADASEIGALHLNQQHLAARAKRFGDRADSQFLPSWRVAQLCFANQAEAFALAEVERRIGG